MQNTSALSRTLSTAIGRLSGNLAVFAVMCLLVFAAGSPGAAVEQKPQGPQADEEKQSRRGPQESIKVHGHWAIDVHNPDGSFVSRTEFENSLVQNDASPFLSQVLAHRASVGPWAILLANTVPGGTQPCIATILGLTAPVPCVLSEPATLQVSVTGGAVQLTGNTTVTAAQNTTITLVSTQFIQCDASCPSGTAGQFTSRSLSQPVSVAPGQIVQVTVTISFS